MRFSNIFIIILSHSQIIIMPGRNTPKKQGGKWDCCKKCGNQFYKPVNSGNTKCNSCNGGSRPSARVGGYGGYPPFGSKIF